eukprot:2657632-Amphidinium_carterae.1
MREVVGRAGVQEQLRESMDAKTAEDRPLTIRGWRASVHSRFVPTVSRKQLRAQTAVGDELNKPFQNGKLLFPTNMRQQQYQRSQEEQQQQEEQEQKTNNSTVPTKNIAL